MRALRNTHASLYRRAARRPSTRELFDEDIPLPAEPSLTAREVMGAIASAPSRYRDAVVAIDVLGMTYRDAARALRTREATITTRLHRGRKHVAGKLSGAKTQAAAENHG